MISKRDAPLKDRLLQSIVVLHKAQTSGQLATFKETFTSIKSEETPQMLVKLDFIELYNSYLFCLHTFHIISVSLD